MTIKTDYVLILIMAVVLIYVAYSGHVTNGKIDDNRNEIKLLKDSVQTIQEQRMGDYMKLVRLQLSVDSLRTKKSEVIIKYATKKGIINSASADSLGFIIRSDIR